jgi:hypothetical protein
MVQKVFGAAAAFEGMAVVCLASCLLLPWLPRGNSAASTHAGGAAFFSRHLAVAGLIGVLLYFIAQGAVWSYFERIGSASGVDAQVIGNAMGISSFAGVGGAFAALLLVSQMGRVWPLIGSGVISIASFWMLRGRVSGTELVVAGILFNFGWNLAQPLLSGICSDADSKGRVVVAMGCIQTVGFGIGPAMTATLLTGHDFGPSLWVSAAVLVLGLLVSLGGLRMETRALSVEA